MTPSSTAFAYTLKFYYFLGFQLTRESLLLRAGIKTSLSINERNLVDKWLGAVR